MIKTKIKQAIEILKRCDERAINMVISILKQQQKNRGD